MLPEIARLRNQNGQKGRASSMRRDELQRDVERERLRALRTIGPDSVMSDGRRLGEWTIGELRKLNGVFAFILGRAGTKDDSRRVDDVMKARDWQQMRRR